jgi:hypothetical protein
VQITDQTLLIRIAQYLEALAADANTEHCYASYTLENKDNTKSHRIIANIGDQINVHAFVDNDGNLYNIAGWDKSPNNPLYNLLNDESFAALIADASWCGRHLYWASARSQGLPELSNT